MPILLVVIQNPDDQQQLDEVVQIFAEANSMIQNILQSQYSLFVVSQEQLEAKLKNSSELFRIHYEDDINAYVLFSKWNKNIAIMHRIRQIELMDETTFMNKL